MKALKYMSVALVLAAALASCSKDFLDAEDYSVLTPDEAAQVAAKNAESYLNGIWSANVDATEHDEFGIMSTLLYFEVMTEDIAFHNRSWFIFDHDLDYRGEQYVRAYDVWSLFYTNISRANEIISLYPNGPQSDEEKTLAGQAYALRGWAYYYLIQIYQDYMSWTGTEAEGQLTPINRDAKGVPIIYVTQDGKSTDEAIAFTGRNTVGAVLDECERNLVKAVTLLTEANYTRPADENGKDFIDASVANGLLARYYLLAQKWPEAAAAAKLARAGYGLRTPEELKDGFMDVTASDVMWGFNHTTETQTTYASFFSHMSNYAPGYSGLDYAAKLIDARLYAQIDASDLRRDLFNGPKGWSGGPQAGAKLPYANLKFGDDGNWTMDYIYMRSPEMVLIEAEAEARQGNIAAAGAVLKELLDVRTKGGTWDSSAFVALTQQQAINYILLQRRIELWGEGFAYFDLKRNNKGMDRNYSGSNHLSGHLLTVPAHDVLWTYQIPMREWQNNDLIDGDKDQNP